MDGRIFHLTKILQEKLDHRWTIEEMSENVGLSSPHLQKLFKSEIGMSPMAYLKDLRLEKARELLENTFLQVKQIGYQTGLTSDNHFTYDFKRKFGMPPMEYRKHYLEIEQSYPPNLPK